MQQQLHLFSQQQGRIAGGSSRRALRKVRCSAIASPATPAGTSVSAIDQLRSWAGSRGVQQVDNIAVSTAIEDGRPILVAAKDIGAGQTVLSVPDSTWLSPEAVKRSNPQIAKAVATLEPWLQTALVLVHERFVARGEWGSYASSLPASNSSPLFWSDEQLQSLKGTQVLGSLKGYRSFFQAKYQELFGPSGVLSTGPAASVFPASAYTWPNFLWAAATVRARAHAPLEGDKFALVPLADSLSHRRQGNTAWKAKSAGFLGRGQSLVVEATRAIRKGEELSMDYAPEKLDGGVLLDYGCLDKTSPRPGYTVTLSLSQSDRLLDDKLDVLEQVGVAPTRTFTLTPGSAPPPEMVQFLRLIHLKGADVFLLEPVFRNDVWGFMADPVSEDNERSICNAMAEGCRAALQGYGSGIDDDLALLRSGTLAKGSPEEAALVVRLGEKESLDAALIWFEERAMGLKRLAYYQERRLRRLGLIDDEGRTTFDGMLKDGIA